jgi:hypothetical protein
MQLTKSRVAAIAAALLLGVSAPAFAETAPQPQKTEDKAETTSKPNPAEQSVEKPDLSKTDKDAAKATENKPDATTTGEAATDAKMVSVNVTAVRDSLATQLQIAAPTIPDVVMAEPDVAGEVCSVAPNSLLATLEAGSPANCTALTTSQALRVAVQKQLAAG